MNTKTKAIIGSGAAALIVGGGVATAMAAEPTPTPSGTSTSAPHKAAGHENFKKLLAGRVLHGEVVVKGKDGKPVTLDGIRGEVTASSATSISVKASDGVSATFVVGADTKVHLVTPATAGGKPTAKDGTMTDVKTGDTVYVAGTKAGDTFTAKQVLDQAK